MTRFDPTTVTDFTVRDWQPVGHELHLRYRLGDLDLQERIELPVPIDVVLDDPRAAALCDLLLLAAGVSYYKAAAPEHVRVEGVQPTAAALTMMTGLYTDGLAEFRWVNGLPLRPALQFHAETRAGATRPVPPPATPRRALVPVGGGKDSILTIELLREASVPTTLFTVGEHGPLARTAAVARRPRVTATRTIDPVLLDLNRRGARNGHVPITAINTLIGMLCAVAVGCDAVVLSNEHSASLPTLAVDGVGVNHQYSKSVAFEADLRAALHAAGVDDPAYFSLLRPLTELAILRRFADLEAYHPVFVSCNSNYSVAKGAASASEWCGHCPKCHFVYLGLAPFRTPDQMRAIFGRDLLADPDLTAGFLALFAVDQTRPFECVGTPVECHTALDLLAEGSWRDHVVVRALRDATAGLSREPFAWCHPEDTHFVPPALLAGLPCT